MASLTHNLTDNPVFKKYQQAIGAINKASMGLIGEFSPQQANMFELFLFPYEMGAGPIEIAKSIAQIAIDTVIVKTHIKSIEGIPMPKIEYETAGYEKYISTINPPEELSITFYENEIGAVFNWLDVWRNKIYKRDKVFNRVFQPYQNGGKRNGWLFLHSKTGLPVPYVWKLTGMQFKTFGDLTIGHEETEPVSVTAIFNVEDVQLYTLAQIVAGAVGL